MRTLFSGAETTSLWSGKKPGNFPFSKARKALIEGMFSAE
jgi:hypothetical protein